ncbi:MAG: hypothetical protein V2B15_07450 [Bacteroidota bacterium]
MLMVVAKRDNALRNARAKALFELTPVKKEIAEYDEEHFLDPREYNKEIIEWMDEEL